MNAKEAIELTRGNYAYVNLGVTAGHRCTCRDCDKTFVEGHTWASTINGFKCAYCRVATTNIELPYPGIKGTYKAMLQRAAIATSNADFYSVNIDEHSAIAFYIGKYYLLVECNEQGQPLYALPSNVLADGYVLCGNAVVKADSLQIMQLLSNLYTT